jgi:hypothetical protein
MCFAENVTFWPPKTASQTRSMALKAAVEIDAYDALL